MRKREWMLILLLVLSVSGYSTPACSGDFFTTSSLQLTGNYEEFLGKEADTMLNADITMSLDRNVTGQDIYELHAQADDTEQESVDGEEEDLDYLESEEDIIADPLEPINRAFFAVNDKLYFWVLKPVTQGYSFVFPEPVRRSVSNFFNNVTTPVRFVNNLLQLKFRHAGNELLRFGINSLAGVLGLFDVAKDQAGIEMQDEDLGQTLGTWGAGPGFFINWPLLGPSSLRDTIGGVGDHFLDPVNYVNPLIDRYAIKATDTVNKTSFRIGDYEEIKKDALDPYAAVRDIYHQYRKSKIDR